MRLSAVGTLALCLSALPIWAIEKEWFAQAAELIVVGTLRPASTVPWSDGWRLRGEIQVDEVLFGRLDAKRIEFRHVFHWKWNPAWPPPKHPEDAREKAIWFLRRVEDGVWGPTVPGWDFGFRPLQERPYWEDYIQRVKLRPQPAANAATGLTSCRQSSSWPFRTAIPSASLRDRCLGP